MAITTLSKEAKEGGTYVIELKFKDEDGNFTNPNTLEWWLSDTSGNPINNREAVPVSDPTSVTHIVLQGADLTPDWKIFTIKGTYNSNYGNDLPLRDAIKFYVRDLIEEDY